MQRLGITITKNKIYALLLFFCIYCSHDTLLFGTNEDSLFVLLRKIIPFVVLFVLILLGFSKGEFLISPKSSLCFIVMALPIFSCVVNQESFNNYLYRFVIMLCAFFLACSDYKERAFKDYCSIMYFLSIWSVIVFTVANTVSSIIERFPVVQNSQGYLFANTLFSFVYYGRIFGVSRNFCIFREPGVFVVFLTIAFLFEILYGDSSKRVKHLLVFTIAILTTVSTAGYIILALIYTYLIIMSKEVKHKAILIVGIIIAITVLLTQTNLLHSDSAMFSKFQIGSNSYGSWFARLSSITENIRIAAKNPIFGLGRYSLYEEILSESGQYIAVDNTNTVLIGFAAYGVAFGMLILVGCWKFIRCHHNATISAIFLLAILLMALSNEDLGQNIIFYFIVFYGLLSIKESSKARRKNNEVCIC